MFSGGKKEGGAAEAAPPGLRSDAVAADQVGDLSDESLVWLLPYREVQDLGIAFMSGRDSRKRKQ